MLLSTVLLSFSALSAPVNLEKRDGLDIADQVLTRVLEGLNAGGVEAGAAGVGIARDVIRRINGGAAPAPTGQAPQQAPQQQLPPQQAPQQAPVGQTAGQAAAGGVGIAQGVLDQVQKGLEAGGVDAGAAGVQIARDVLKQVAANL